MLLSTAINSVVIKSNSCKAYLGRVTLYALRITFYVLRFTHHVSSQHARIGASAAFKVVGTLRVP